MCYNEEAIIGHTVRYYLDRFPNATITIMDNESTDESVQIARELGCQVDSFFTYNILNEYELVAKRNSCFQHIKNGWIIVADMDEWLDITEDDLYEEQQRGTTILKTIGYDIVGDSTTSDLSDVPDIDIYKEGVEWGVEGNKNLCFYRPHIQHINYIYGAHRCFPEGQVIFSEKVYLLRHMSFLGLEYLIAKYKNRFDRTELMRSHGFSGHYTDDRKRVEDLYYRSKANRKFVVL